MNTCCIVAIFLGFALVVEPQNLGEKAIDVSKFNPGEGKRLNFNYDISGTGRNSRNWNAGGEAALGAKVWESKNGRASVGVGGSYQRDFTRHQGRTYRGKGNYGLGASFTYRFGKK